MIRDQYVPVCAFLLVLCNSALCRLSTAVCLFCRVSVRTFHLSWLLMAGVHASALIRVLWTCRLIAEEAEQVITFESLIVQMRRKKNTGQGGSHGWGVKITFRVPHWAGSEHQDLITGLSIQVWGLGGTTFIWTGVCGKWQGISLTFQFLHWLQ